MKVIIAGGRDFGLTGDSLVRCALQASRFRAKITEVVCGMAPGIDTHGKIWANENGIPVKEFPADWKKHGKAAGPIRNKQMSEYADALILIWDGESRGSRSMLSLAKDKGIPIEEIIVKDGWTEKTVHNYLP